MLNETGKEQTERLGTKFKYEHLTRIYSSDLDRAIKVATFFIFKQQCLVWPSQVYGEGGAGRDQLLYTVSMQADVVFIDWCINLIVNFMLLIY